MILQSNTITHTLIGCFFDTHNSLGVGYDEKAYHKALERRFQEMGIEYQSIVAINIQNIKVISIRIS